ncbi:SGNH/GDSL hydrolase family protein [Burkholderia vietnamiensis]|uniref:SGNH/GDSL hydrolase family protein n=1 Tax=Burkholderia vietnamiensis TaxID=60552 RepID=UPI001589199A|nr:SGNH/GDSL hydrolase family protein [Burkholderia vietnamiensis]MCA8183840.1 SGNH/GDSL hydrolase family protein [Burkholderia vietnamiensis]
MAETATTKLSEKDRVQAFSGNELFPVVKDGKTLGGTPEVLAEFVAPMAAQLAPVTEATAQNADAASTAATTATQAAATAQGAAGTAEAAADRSVTNAETALQSSQQAQAAAAAKGVYASTALGVAATTSGQGFYIPSASGNGSVDLYLNASGAAVFQSTVPNINAALTAGGTINRPTNHLGYLYALMTPSGKALMRIRYDGTLLAKLPIVWGKGMTLTKRADGMLVVDTISDNTPTYNGFLGAIKTPGGKRLAAWRWDGMFLSKLPLRSGDGASIVRTADEFYRVDTLHKTSRFVGGMSYAEVTPAGKLVRGVDARGVPVGKVQHHEAAAYSTDGAIAAWISTDPLGNLLLKTQDATGVVRTLFAVKNPSAAKVDSGRIMFFGTVAGESSYWYCAPDGSGLHRVMPRSSIYCGGDSLTDGSGKSLPANAYPQRLAARLGRAVYNDGVPGNTSASIAARQGGYTYTGVVAGNTIPVAGGVVVSGYSIDPLAPQTSSYSVRVFLNGVDGTITRSGGVDTFVPTVKPANPIAVPNPCPIVANSLGMDEWIQLIWAGANDGYDMTKIMPAIQAMIANLKPITKRFAILSLTLKNSEIIGTAGYNACMAANAALQAAFPNNFIDVNTALINAYDPNNPQDVIDHANGTTPSSLHSDDRHFNDAGYDIIAHTSQVFILSKGW